MCNSCHSNLRPWQLFIMLLLNKKKNIYKGTWMCADVSLSEKTSKNLHHLKHFPFKATYLFMKACGHSLPSSLLLSLCSWLPNWEYLPLHPADWNSTVFLPQECLEPRSNQSKTSSSTTCTQGIIDKREGGEDAKTTGQTGRGNMQMMEGRRRGKMRKWDGWDWVGKKSFAVIANVSCPHGLLGIHNGISKTGNKVRGYMETTLNMKMD